MKNSEFADKEEKKEVIDEKISELETKPDKKIETKSEKKVDNEIEKKVGTKPA